MNKSEKKKINEEKLNKEQPEEREEEREDFTEEMKENGEIEKLKEDLAAVNDKYVRLYAEFDNYRRRTRQEQANLLLTASEKVVTSLLPIIDDFSRAFDNIEKEDSFKEGVKIINDKFSQILKTNGVTKIETKCGDDFDENFHEAIVKQKTEEKDMIGKIICIMENGYKMHDKILKYVKVIVGD
ncbi:MAG: nucleotide exchange factor GrpE [Cytophagales bacterium]|jgi:molecular chaperone GrpE|nr:nucleotide exchange factor GrpE [Cytophagales bacterium]